MKEDKIITLGNLMYDTLVTGIIMTLLVGGFGLIGIIKALKEGVVFSKEELFRKGDFYTNLQMFFVGLGLLSFSLWFNIYENHLFTYLSKIQLFFTSKHFNHIDINGIDFFPILLGLFIFLGVFGGTFSKTYASKKNKLYLLEFNKFDKFFGFIPLLIILITLYTLDNDISAKNNTFSTSIIIIISTLLILLGMIFLLYFMKKYILFNNEIIEFHTFWRKKKTIYWKDVKDMSYENTNRQNMILTTKDDKQYKINTRFSGLTSFISTYKIRNNSKPPSNK